MFKRNEELILEYKTSLKNLRACHRAIEKKKITVVEDEQEQGKETDTRTSIDIEDQSRLSSMIRDCEYTIFWLENGYEKPHTDDDFRKLCKSKREQLWGDIDEAVCFYGSSVTTDDLPTKQKTEQHEMMLEVLSTLSPRELELFKLKNECLLTEEECAKTMGISLGTVKSMSQRIRDKVDNYFNYGFQIELF